jgi:hypothetical protein
MGQGRTVAVDKAVGQVGVARFDPADDQGIQPGDRSTGPPARRRTSRT